MVDLANLPLERLQVPQASGNLVGYVPVQYGSFEHRILGAAVNDRLVGLLNHTLPVVPDRMNDQAERLGIDPTWHR